PPMQRTCFTSKRRILRLQSAFGEAKMRSEAPSAWAYSREWATLRALEIQPRDTPAGWKGTPRTNWLPGVSIGGGCPPNHRWLRGDSCNPKGSGPVPKGDAIAQRRFIFSVFGIDD